MPVASTTKRATRCAQWVSNEARQRTHTRRMANHKRGQHHRTPSKEAQPTSQQIRLLTEPVREVDAATEQAATTDVVGVRHTTIESLRQHKLRSDRLAMLLVSRRREQAQIKANKAS
jgi:hypothetical protein